MHSPVVEFCQAMGELDNSPALLNILSIELFKSLSYLSWLTFYSITLLIDCLNNCRCDWIVSGLFDSHTSRILQLSCRSLLGIFIESPCTFLFILFFKLEPLIDVSCLFRNFFVQSTSPNPLIMFLFSFVCEELVSCDFCEAEPLISHFCLLGAHSFIQGAWIVFILYSFNFSYPLVSALYYLKLEAEKLHQSL
jgi:hypothetical protein